MFVFNVALGKVNYFGQLPEVTDALILVPFEVSDDVDEDLRGLETLADVTAVLTESSAGRVTATSALVTGGVASLVNPGWTTPAADLQITRILICYKPDSSSLDADIMPLVSLDVDWTPDGVQSFTIDLTAGYYQATGYQYV